MRRIRIMFLGEERDAVLVDRIYSRKMRRKGRSGIRTWIEYTISVYVPKPWLDKKFIIIPISDEEYEALLKGLAGGSEAGEKA